MGLASWRAERTASVGFREEGWVDFGASARRADGKPDGGDALELTIRVNDESKPEIMREIARQLVSEARHADCSGCGFCRSALARRLVTSVVTLKAWKRLSRDNSFLIRSGTCRLMMTTQ